MMLPAIVIFTLTIADTTPVETASRFLTGAAAQGAASVPQTDVVTSAELRTALDLEAQKQLTACDEGSSCMAEIAAALDAQIVLTSSLISIGSSYTIQVSAYDAKKAISAGRKTIRAGTIEELAPLLEATTKEMLTPVAGATSQDTKLRVLILDLDASGASLALGKGLDGESKSREKEKSTLGYLSVGGAISGVVGVISGAIGGVLIQIADNANAEISADPRPTIVKQRELANSRDALLMPGVIAAIGGGVLVLAGATVVAVDGVIE